MRLWVVVAIILSALVCSSNQISVKQCRHEKFRHQLHWSVLKNWSNDPNGLVYYDGEYHMYYQYHPFSSQSGPKYWGHVLSTDLFHWIEQPTALHPDSLGEIYSGSAIVDLKNTSGLQPPDSDVAPILAYFTHAGLSQQQSLAYSLNTGIDYTKYYGNPVISNPPPSKGGIPDFRDPKVFLFNATLTEQNWKLIVAAGNRIQFYGSNDLKTWTLQSEFGNHPMQGSHGGVWECPDIMKFTVDAEEFWVLTVSNYGGPNGGSGTQYFIGRYDGIEFSSDQFDPLWLEHGKDNYAGVTFSNEPTGRKIFIGWMTNSDYAGSTPTRDWRGQMTLPRTLELVKTPRSGILRMKSMIVDEISVLYNNDLKFPLSFREIGRNEYWKVSEELNFRSELVDLTLNFNISMIRGLSSLAICFVNSAGRDDQELELCTGYDNQRPHKTELFLNRERTGNLGNISGAFTRRLVAGREISDDILKFRIIMDVSAIEVFIDDGLTAMTALFYPKYPLDTLEIRHHSNANNSHLFLVDGVVQVLNSIYDF